MRLTPHVVTLRQLQYVVAVAEQRSFRKAAEECRVSQPSLSAQIAQAEELLGIRLFERDRRAVALTSAGEALVLRARQVLVGADELEDAARQLGDPLAGTLRIGVIPTVAPYLLPEIAPALRAAYPRLAFLWVEDKTPTLIQKLAQGELDGALVALEAELGNVSSAILGKDVFVFASAPSHPLARAASPTVEPAQLEGESVLLLDDGHCFRDQALAFCAKTGADEAGFRATSLSTLVQMTAGGAAVTLLPRLALAVENRHNDLAVRPFTGKGPTRTIALVWRRRSAREVTLKPVAETMKASYAQLERRARPRP